MKIPPSHHQHCYFVYNGRSMSFLRMAMDLTKGMYVYHEQTPFILSTTQETHAHMDTSMDLMNSIKL